MNRAERRKAGVAGKVKTYTLTQEQIDKMKREATDEAMWKAFVYMLGIPVLSLRDKFGFGKDRLTRFMDSVMTWYESVQNGEVTLDEIISTIKEETGVEVGEFYNEDSV